MSTSPQAVNVPPGGWLTAARPDGSLVQVTRKTFENRYRQQGFSLVDQPTDRALRIFADVHMAAPEHNAGAEWMLHSLLREMVRRGHQARIGARDGTPGEYQGVRLCGPASTDDYVWSDVVITHLDRSRDAIRLAGVFRRPLVHLVHNDDQLRYNQVLPRNAQLVVFNSHWMKQAVPFEAPSIIVRPPVVAADYRTAITGGAITLVNLTQAKGAGTFFELARAMPERPFIAVIGSYGRQVMPGDVPNVEYVLNTPDMRSIYARTRILAMPSLYESWGRVAIEAACSGIPTIAHPTEGLVESLGTAGIFVDRDDLEGWKRAIEALDVVGAYARASTAAKRRVRELDPKHDFDAFEAALRSISPRHRIMDGLDAN